MHFGVQSLKAQAKEIVDLATMKGMFVNVSNTKVAAFVPANAIN